MASNASQAHTAASLSLGPTARLDAAVSQTPNGQQYGTRVGANGQTAGFEWQPSQQSRTSTALTNQQGHGNDTAMELYSILSHGSALPSVMAGGPEQQGTDAIYPGAAGSLPEETDDYIPFIPEGAFVVVQQPDDTCLVGIDYERVPKPKARPPTAEELRRLQRQFDLEEEAAQQAAAAEWLRNKVRPRRIALMCLLAADMAYFLVIILYLLISGKGIRSLTREGGFSGKLGVKPWINITGIHVEKAVGAIAVDAFGLAASYRESGYLVSFFLVLYLLLTLLVDIPTVSFFLVHRIVTVLVALWFRSGAMHYQVLSNTTTPDHDTQMGLTDMARTMVGFFGILFGREAQVVQGSSTTHVRRVSAHGISSTAAQGANSTAARSSMQPARSSAYARGAAELQPSTRQVASTPAGQGANTAASRTVGAAQTGGVSGQGSMMLHHLQSQLAMLQQQQSDQSWSQSAPSSMREGQRLGPAGPAWVGPRMALQGAVQGGGGRTQERSAGQFIEMAHEPAGGRSMAGLNSNALQAAIHAALQEASRLRAQAHAHGQAQVMLPTQQQHQLQHAGMQHTGPTWGSPSQQVAAAGMSAAPPSPAGACAHISASPNRAEAGSIGIGIPSAVAMLTSPLYVPRSTTDTPRESLRSSSVHVVPMQQAQQSALVGQRSPSTTAAGAAPGVLTAGHPDSHNTADSRRSSSNGRGSRRLGGSIMSALQTQMAELRRKVHSRSSPAARTQTAPANQRAGAAGVPGQHSSVTGQQAEVTPLPMAGAHSVSGQLQALPTGHLQQAQQQQSWPGPSPLQEQQYMQQLSRAIHTANNTAVFATSQASNVQAMVQTHTPPAGLSTAQHDMAAMPHQHGSVGQGLVRAAEVQPTHRMGGGAADQALHLHQGLVHATGMDAQGVRHAEYAQAGHGQMQQLQSSSLDGWPQQRAHAPDPLWQEHQPHQQQSALSAAAVTGSSNAVNPTGVAVAFGGFPNMTLSMTGGSNAGHSGLRGTGSSCHTPAAARAVPANGSSSTSMPSQVQSHALSFETDVETGDFSIPDIPLDQPMHVPHSLLYPQRNAEVDLGRDGWNRAAAGAVQDDMPQQGVARAIAAGAPQATAASSAARMPAGVSPQRMRQSRQELAVKDITLSLSPERR